MYICIYIYVYLLAHLSCRLFQKAQEELFLEKKKDHEGKENISLETKIIKITSSAIARN